MESRKRRIDEKTTKGKQKKEKWGKLTKTTREMKKTERSKGKEKKIEKKNKLEHVCAFPYILLIHCGLPSPPKTIF